VLEVSGQHWLGDQVALEALVRFSDEELKHQELFRRIETLLEAHMPAGYRKVADPNDVARAVLSKSTWSVLALTCLIELFTQTHYRQSIEPETNVSPLWKDVFRYHWMEEAQHAMLDELEWTREDARVTAEQKERAVDDLIDLVGAVDGILQAQGGGGRRLLHGDRRARVHRGRGRGHARRGAARLPVAVHRLGRPADPLRPPAHRHDHGGADATHPDGAGADRERMTGTADGSGRRRRS
jgi:hypothetical protein